MLKMLVPSHCHDNFFFLLSFTLIESRGSKRVYIQKKNNKGFYI